MFILHDGKGGFPLVRLAIGTQRENDHVGMRS